jgi:ABC-type cobalamin/Fe3+-siderophores transport system ATPase subunit
MLIHDGALLFHGPIAQGLTPENIGTVYGVRSHMAEGRIIFDY